MKRLTNDSGYVAVWVLVSISLLIVGYGLLRLSGPHPVSTTTWIVCGAAFVIALAGMAFETVTNFYGTAKFMTVLGVLGAIISLGVAGNSQKLGTVAAASAAAFAALFIGSLTYLLYNQFRDGEVTNILRERFGRSAVYEMDGVQFVVEAPATTFLYGGQTGSVVVWVQNCWDTPRECSLRIKEDFRIFFGKSGDVLFPSEVSTSLGPAEVLRLTVPVAAEPDARGGFSLDLRPRVSGSGGTRLRPWRAQPLSRPIPWWVILLLAPFGALVWGGGMKIKVRARPQEAPPVELPSVTRQVVWRPE